MNLIHQKQRGLISNLGLWAIASAMVVVMLAWLALRMRPDVTNPVGESVKIYCAAGVAKPVENAIRIYNDLYDGNVEIVRAAGSGELAGQLKTEFESGLVHGADIYITADDSLLDQFQKSAIVAERFPLATQRPVIAIASTRKNKINSLVEMVNDEDIQFGIASNRAAVGKMTRRIASKEGVLSQLENSKRVETENVMNLAQALVTGSLDAAIIWDTTIQQINQQNDGQLLKLSCLADQNDKVQSNISLGVISSCEHPTAALRFARFLSARNGGLKHFSDFGYRTIPGDQWDEAPELHVYMGSMFTPVLESEVRKFANREGISLYSRWEGCGKLISSMDALSQSELFPDAFLACDAQFMAKVQHYFFPPLDISENSVVLAVANNWTHKVDSIDDALAAGLRIGICDPDQSALGLLTKQILTETQLEHSYQQVKQSAAVVVDVGPTLVSQMLSGGLDVAVVYRSNVMADPAVLKNMAIHPIGEKNTSSSVAVQQWAVSKSTPYPRLMDRLLATMMEAENKERFKRAGFELRPSD